MSVDVLTETIIDRPVEQVSSFAGDPGNVPKWYQNITSVRWVTDPPICVGSRLAFVARFLGRELRYTYEIAHFEPGRQLVMRTTEGAFPMETTYAWEAVGTGSTRMTLRNRGEPRGFGKIAAPVMEAAMRRANTKDLARLKDHLERAQRPSTEVR